MNKKMRKVDKSGSRNRAGRLKKELELLGKEGARGSTRRVGGDQERCVLVNFLST